MRKYKKNPQKGFTLIELLMVMGILGALAIIVLVALNPRQQFARTRDASRKSAVTQLGRALEGHFASRGIYIGTTNTSTGNWITLLQTAGEISTPPSQVNYVVGLGGAVCNVGSAGVYRSVENNYCYRHNFAARTAVVYATMESASELQKCGGSTPATYFVYSTFNGRAGIVCRASYAAANVPQPGNQAFTDPN